MRAFGEHAAFVQHRHVPGNRSHELHVVLDDDTEWAPASETSSSAVRSTSCGVMPATGSSTSSSFGSCISSMPISSHCLWPWPSAPAIASRRSAKAGGGEHAVHAVAAGRRHPRPQHLPERSRSGQGQLEVLGDRQVLEDGRLLELAADAGPGDLGLAHGQQIELVPEPGPAFVGPRLAGDDVHHRRLAGAVRSDDAAQLAGLHVERQRVQRLEAVEADGQLLEVEDVGGDGLMRCPLRGAGTRTTTPAAGRRGPSAGAASTRMKSAPSA